MTAPSKTFTTIADSAVDVDSPLDTTLVTALRNNGIHNYEWIGQGFTPVQAHTHDGLDSHLIEVGPNLLRNGSFESGESGWSYTGAGGSSRAIITGGIEAVYRAAITSTVLANGGGYFDSAPIFATAAENYWVQGFIWAATANVSSQVAVHFFDSSLSFISSTVVYSSTNTPTSATRYDVKVTTPANTRFIVIGLYGQVAATGASTGTIYHDAVRVHYQMVGTGQVDQARLKWAYGYSSLTDPASDGWANWLSPGGGFGFVPQVEQSTDSANTISMSVAVGGQDATDTTPTYYYSTYTTRSTVGSDGPLIYFPWYHAGGTYPGTQVFTVSQYYIQASPPYDLGDGEVPLFMFARLSKSGKILEMSIAPDPPWANNGPTNIRADYYRGNVGFKKMPALLAEFGSIEAAIASGLSPAEVFDRLHGEPLVDAEITAAIKNADMPALPHPFGSREPDDVVVLLDPVSELSAKMLEWHRHCDRDNRIAHLFARGYLELDNTPLSRATPADMPAVGFRWKKTG